MQLNVLVLILCLALTQTGVTNGARILAAVPTASYSHQMFFQQIWRELALRSHEIVVLTTDPTHEKLPGFKEIDMSSAYPIIQQGIADVIALNDDKLAVYNRFLEVFHDMTEYELGLPEVQALIRNPEERFDLVMIEYLYPSFFAFKHRFNCSFIGVTSLDGMNVAHDVMGDPVHGVLYPSNLLPAADLTFGQRVQSFIFNRLTDFKRAGINARVDELNRKYFGEGVPSVQTLSRSVDMLFINDNPMFAPVRPLVPGTISIAGGVHMKPAKALPEDLKKFLDGSTNGVVYFSMGSNVKSKDLSNETLSVIMETFSGLPFNFLWKFEADNLPGKPDNVKIIKWAPQQDVLRHPNVKLFITQAGMQSLEEALFAHMPLVTMPFLGDQDANAAKIAQKQLGLRLNYKTLNVEDFTSAILEVTGNPKYKANIVKLASQLEDQPMTPLERAVWWTEYVLRHKDTKHLHGPKIPNYQFYYLDVLAILLVAAIVTLLVIYKSTRIVFGMLARVVPRVTIKMKQT